LAQDNNLHKAWLSFVRKAVDVPLGYSKTDLEAFLNLARRESPSLVPLIRGYLMLAQKSETVAQQGERPTRQSNTKRNKASQMHLFDLLREKQFFPQNLELANFAARVMPHMRTYRFDKMSRSDIAARIIEHIESSDPRARDALEQSMRDALTAIGGRKSSKEVDRRSFLSKWERIIKGIEF
jgi:hypothetical protein